MFYINCRIICKILTNIDTFLSGTNDSRGKLLSLLALATIFVDSLKVTQIAFIVADFTFSSCKSKHFWFTILN